MIGEILQKLGLSCPPPSRQPLHTLHHKHRERERERKVHSRVATTVGIEGEDETNSNKFRKTQMPLSCSSFMIGIIPLQRNTTCLELIFISKDECIAVCTKKNILVDTERAVQAAGLGLGDGLGRGRRQSCELYRPHGLGNASETSLGWQEKSVVRTRYRVYQTQPSPCLALDIRTDTAGDSSRGPPEIKDQTGTLPLLRIWNLAERLSILHFYPKKLKKQNLLMKFSATLK